MVPSVRHFLGDIGWNHCFPVGPAEHVIAKGKRIAEIVLFHDPWGAEAAAIDAVLDDRLGKKNLFQNFREGIAAGIGLVWRFLGDGTVMAIEEMADAGIAADENELLRRLALTERFKQPEHALHRHVHDNFGGFLAGGEMDDMGDARHGALDAFAV